MIRDEIRFSFLLFFFVTFRMNIKYLSRSISMRIKDCRYRVVCSRSEELLRFTNLTTVLRFSLIHQLPIFDDHSLSSSLFFSVFNWFLSNHIEPRISLTFTITPFILVQSLRCTKSTILFLLDDREKYTVFPSRWRNLLIPRFSLLKWSTTRSQG